MVPKLTFSSESKTPGVQADGYMILGTGAYSKRRLFDSINEEWNNKVSQMSERLRTKGVELSVANKDKDQLNLNIDTAIARINSRKDGDDGKKRSRGGHGRSSMWDDDDEF